MLTKQLKELIKKHPNDDYILVSRTTIEAVISALEESQRRSKRMVLCETFLEGVPNKVLEKGIQSIPATIRWPV